MAGVGCTPTSSAAFVRRGSSSLWRHQVVAAEAAHARAARRALDRHRVRQVAGLPAARPSPRSSNAAAPGASAGLDDPLHQPHEGARAGPARVDRRPRARRPRRPRTTATRRTTSATGRASTASTSSPTPTCSTARCCPGTSGGRGLFRSLDLVVVDECHHYRGVFGAHVAQVLRRLRRVCAPSRRRPDVRARLGHGRQPAEHAVAASPGSTSWPSARTTPLAGEVALALWEPRFTSYAGENGAPVRRAASSESADLLADLVSEGVRTLAFVRSRRAPSRSRYRGRDCSPRSTRRCRTGWRATAAATSPRSAARSSRRCATAR